MGRKSPLSFSVPALALVSAESDQMNVINILCYDLTTDTPEMRLLLTSLHPDTTYIALSFLLPLQYQPGNLPSCP